MSAPMSAPTLAVPANAAAQPPRTSLRALLLWGGIAALLAASWKGADMRPLDLIRDFMLGYGKDAREKAILATLEYSGFRASSNAQLIPIRQIELARARAAVEADTTLSADDKAAKLKDIDSRLADLGRQVASK